MKKYIRKYSLVLFSIVVFAVVVSLFVWTSFISPMTWDKPIDPIPTIDPELLVVVRYATHEEQEQRDRETVEVIAQTVWGEARGCSTTEQAAVVWCILNRVDSPDFPNDPLMVVQQQGQFDGYDSNYPIEPDIVALVEDVMARWKLEKTAVGSVGRVLPKEYVFFRGTGKVNLFRDAYKGGNTWGWSLESPYK